VHVRHRLPTYRGTTAQHRSLQPTSRRRSRRTPNSGRSVQRRDDESNPSSVTTPYVLVYGGTQRPPPRNHIPLFPQKLTPLFPREFTGKEWSQFLGRWPLCTTVLVTISCDAIATACVTEQWFDCPATGGGSLSLKLVDYSHYTFVRLGEKFRTTKHSIPPCTRKVCFCSQLCMWCSMVEK